MPRYYFVQICHGEDLAYIFHPNASSLDIHFTPQEAALAESMQDFYSNFARTGAPGSVSEWAGVMLLSLLIQHNTTQLH